MPDLDTIVQVTITATTVTPSRAGFGTPLIAAFFPTTIFPERVRQYSSITAMTADGFGANDPVVRAATAIFSQNPHPPIIKVGRRANAPIQSIDITPTDTTEGVVNNLSVVSPDGTVTAISFTNGGSETIATIVTALQALLTAITGLTATDIGPGTLVRCVADTAGDLFDYNTIANSLDILDGTADPGFAADLTAIRTEDDDWYALLLDSNSKAEIAAAAALIEALTKIGLFNSADSEVKDDVSGNIAETLEVANDARSALLFNEEILSYAAAAWAGKNLPTDPGSITWAFKTLAGIVADDLTDTETSNIESNDANHYQRTAGIDLTLQGTMANGQFIDVQRTIDALTARIQEDIFTILVNQPKLPYTNASVSLIKGTIRGAIRSFQDDEALDPETDPTITAPRVEDVASADRANRLLPDVEFTARIAGAIHSLTIQGTLTI